jgi:hypothetical protein
VNLRDAAFGALVAAFPNTGLMGMPLLTALLGAAAAAPVMVTLLVDRSSPPRSAWRSLSCTAAPTFRGAPGARGDARAFAQSAPWAIGLGALFSAAGWRLPQRSTRWSELLAGAATPVALFTIGACCGVPASGRGGPTQDAPPPSARDSCRWPWSSCSCTPPPCSVLRQRRPGGRSHRSRPSS